MKRWFAKLFVVLLLGAIINVAVAWGCVAWSGFRYSWTIEGEVTPRDRKWIEDVGCWVTSSTPHWRYWVGMKSLRALGLREDVFTELRDFTPEYKYSNFGSYHYLPLNFAIRTYAGWPVEALSSDRWAAGCHGTVYDPMWDENDSSYKVLVPFRLRGGRIPCPVSQWDRAFAISVPALFRSEIPSSDRVLPLRPIWSGFTINTVFYAAFLWLFAIGQFTLRRMIRRVRGFCLKCGYDLRGDLSAGCPECGWRREEGTER